MKEILQQLSDVFRKMDIMFEHHHNEKGYIENNTERNRIQKDFIVNHIRFYLMVHLNQFGFVSCLELQKYKKYDETWMIEDPLYEKKYPANEKEKWLEDLMSFLKILKIKTMYEKPNTLFTDMMIKGESEKFLYVDTENFLDTLRMYLGLKDRDELELMLSGIQLSSVLLDEVDGMVVYKFYNYITKKINKVAVPRKY